VVLCFDSEYAEDSQMLYVVMEKGEVDFSKLMKDISKTSRIPIFKVICYWVEMLRAVKTIHEKGKFTRT
jgi:serine/threonine protein kinase